jgi:hypothetical protein
MRGARPAKPLPVYSWVEPVDDEMAALCASCTVAVRQRMWSDERRDFEFVTYVWSAGAFALIPRASLRKMSRDFLENWAAVAIAQRCRRSSDQPPTRYHHLPLYAKVAESGQWILEARPAASNND